MGGSDVDIYNATFCSTGKYGGHLSFDGTNSWVGLMHRVSPKLHRAKKICVSVWMKSDEPSTPGAIITSPVHITMAGFSLQCLNGKIWMGGRSCISDSFQTLAFPLPAVGEWHHLVALWDFENDAMRLWVDKAEQSSTGTVSFASDRYIRQSPSTQDAVGKNYQNTYFFRGDLDELHIYKRALSDAEIGELYDGQTECELSGRFAVKNRNLYEKLYLVATTNIQSNVKNVGVKTWDGSDFQKWQVTPVAGGVRSYFTLDDSWYLRGGYTNGDNVTAVDYATPPAANCFKWRLLYLGDGQYRMQSAADDYLRANGDGGWDDGDNVEILEWQGWNSQRWLLYPLDY